MKIWWSQNEAMYGMLLAYYFIRNPKYEKLYDKIHDWSHVNFSDPIYDEWYGYQHRDGSVAFPFKRSSWKDRFIF